MLESNRDLISAKAPVIIRGQETQLQFWDCRFRDAIIAASSAAVNCDGRIACGLQGLRLCCGASRTGKVMRISNLKSASRCHPSV